MVEKHLTFNTKIVKSLLKQNRSFPLAQIGLLKKRIKGLFVFERDLLFTSHTALRFRNLLLKLKSLKQQYSLINSRRLVKPLNKLLFFTLLGKLKLFSFKLPIFVHYRFWRNKTLRIYYLGFYFRIKHNRCNRKSSYLQHRLSLHKLYPRRRVKSNKVKYRLSKGLRAYILKCIANKQMLKYDAYRSNFKNTIQTLNIKPNYSQIHYLCQETISFKYHMPIPKIVNKDMSRRLSLRDFLSRMGSIRKSTRRTKRFFYKGRKAIRVRKKVIKRKRRILRLSYKSKVIGLVFGGKSTGFKRRRLFFSRNRYVQKKYSSARRLKIKKRLKLNRSKLLLHSSRRSRRTHGRKRWRRKTNWNYHLRYLGLRRLTRLIYRTRVQKKLFKLRRFTRTL